MARIALPPYSGPVRTLGAVRRLVLNQGSRRPASWARLIHKVYEVDPLECPKCGAPMQVIALIDDAEVIRRILEHLGCWAPREVQRNPRAAEGREGTKITGARTDPPSRSRHRLSC